MRRYADTYLDQLIARSDYGALVDLQGILMSGTGVDFEKTEYGLPSNAFVFVELILWFAQSVRSGTWTYFEATSKVRQTAMYHALKAHAPNSFAENYKFGSENWEDPEQMNQLDRWIDEADSACIEWLSGFQRKNRDLFWALYA